MTKTIENTAVIEDGGDFFKLVDADIPRANRGAKASVYGKLVDEFVETNKKSVQVSSNKKNTAVMNGLRHAIETKGMKDTIAVVQREGDVYLRNLKAA